MEDIINNLKKSDTCKFELMISIKFMASKNTDEERLMHSKSDNIEIENKADEVIEEILPSLLFMYQIEITMKGSSFIIDHVHLLHCKCHKIYSNCSGSYNHIYIHPIG